MSDKPSYKELEKRVAELENRLGIYETRVENALREAETNYRQLTEAMFESLSVIDLNGIFLYANPKAACELSNGAFDDITGKNIRQFLPEYQAELFVEQFRSVYSSNEPYSQEIFLQLKKGGTWFFNTLKPINYGTLQTPAVLYVSLDISERKQAEQALKDAHDRFIAVLDGIDATVHVADMQTHEILFMNKKLKEIFGQDLTGKLCYQIFRGLDEPCYNCTNNQFLDTDGKPSGVMPWQDKNPITDRLYVNYDRAIKWTDGRVVRLQVGTDVTDIKKMEKQLLQAQKMESIGNLAGGIAHDFNNILFPIIGLAELLMEDLPANSIEYENIKEIYNAGKRGSTLVSQILAFSRKTEQKKMPVRIQQILKEVMTLCRSTLPSNISITKDVQVDCGLILADPVQIHQIIMNLITNAYHAIEQTNGKINIQLRAVDISGDDEAKKNLCPGRYAKLSVSDNGVGIKPDILHNIFEPYFTTKKPGKGTGLGLAVVYGIVKEQSGNIKVHSKPGEGTIFDVYLPMHAEMDKMVLEGEQEDVPVGKEHILLVDDEKAIVKFERQMLERLGYKVTSRISSQGGLDAFKACPESFDLVISDMTMPGMTGDRLAEELLSIRPDIPILICTGFSEKLNQKNVLDLGIKGILVKPVIKSVMAKMIRKVLDEIREPGKN